MLGRVEFLLTRIPTFLLLDLQMMREVVEDEWQN